MKDLYSENEKIFMKGIEDDRKKWKSFRVHRLEKLIVLKCTFYPKQSTDLMQSVSK